MEIEIALAVVILIAMVFLATVDLAFAHISDVGLRRLASDAEDSKNQQTARFLREILEFRLRFRLALSATIQVLLISSAVIVTLVGIRITTTRTGLVVFSLVVGLAVTVIFRQVIPRLIVRNDPDKKFLFLLPIVRPIYLLIYAVTSQFMSKPKTKEQMKLDATIAPDATDVRDDDGDEDFQALMEVGEAEGIIEEKERELIESMVEFTETRAGEIMTPRTEICAVPVGTTVRVARDLMTEEKYSRLPVYRDNIDNVEGVLYVRDLLQAWKEGKEDAPIESIVRDAYFVPETKAASELLKSMQVNHVQIAIVIDEYGGVAGIVTVEDIIEEIVGEIEDEDIEDEEIIEIIEGEAGYWDVLGSTEIDKIERLFDIELEDDEYTTVAGMITSETGHVPKAGEILSLRGLEAKILKADEKRVSLVRLRRDDDGNNDSDLNEAAA
ncbi:MAG TPA: hemolysin family protein [Pyrinomonadaceae bacterium]|nr:hemolysin family protein [Pyrinomonadaceae bacterium]